jgi:iron complex transport system ATP-binding protein
MVRSMMLKISNLSCGYGRRVVLRGVSFAIKRGEFLGIIGPNGSGKTTLLRAITGLLHPFEGTILLEGRETDALGRRELAQKVAVVTQLPEAAPSFSVEEFVLMGRIPHWSRLQLLETHQDVEKAERAMALTGIAYAHDCRMGELSGGEQQLAFVARALAQEPRLLLLDEPTAHLDIGHQGQIMDLLRRLNRERSLTIAVVLHDLALASLYCERLILLHQGRLRKIGPPKRVLTKEVIEEVYQTAVRVVKAPERGDPIILPRAGKNP